MTKKTEKSDKTTAAASGPLFALGIDDKGKARGARFDQFDDKLANALLDLGLNIVIRPSTAFADAAKRLPEGRRYASGKLIVPDVRSQLVEELLAVVRKPGDTSEALRLESKSKRCNDAPAGSEVRCKSPITSGLPRTWDEVDIGHLVLAHAGPEDGWWESVVTSRSLDILVLRYRDAPKLPTFQRHVSTVALINPGPLTEHPQS